jgi:predicted transglutaminase-like protease
MTEDQNKLLINFETRVRQLVFLCDELKQENNELRLQLDILKTSYYNLEAENKTIKVKYDNLKMVRIVSIRQDDFKGAKARLSNLVKEVDKCIALLNE